MLVGLPLKSPLITKVCFRGREVESLFWKYIKFGCEGLEVSFKDSVFYLVGPREMLRLLIRRVSYSTSSVWTGGGTKGRIKKGHCSSTS